MLNFTSAIGQALHNDHVGTLATLQSVDMLLRRRSNVVPDLADPQERDAFTQFVDTVDREVGRHFAFEEGELFPLLAAAGQSGMVAMLTMEHRDILPVAQEAARLAATALADGKFEAADWKAFRELAAEFLERELFHIQKEEMGLLAAVGALIPADVDQRLAAAYRESNPS